MSDEELTQQCDIVLNAMALGHAYAATSKGLPAGSTRMFDWAGLLLAVKHYTSKNLAVCAVLSEKYLKKLKVPEQLNDYIVVKKGKEELIVLSECAKHDSLLVDNKNYDDNWNEKFAGNESILNWFRKLKK